MLSEEEEGVRYPEVGVTHRVLGTEHRSLAGVEHALNHTICPHQKQSVKALLFCLGSSTAS